MNKEDYGNLSAKCAKLKDDNYFLLLDIKNLIADKKSLQRDVKELLEDRQELLQELRDMVNGADFTIEQIKHCNRVWSKYE